MVVRLFMVDARVWFQRSAVLVASWPAQVVALILLSTTLNAASSWVMAVLRVVESWSRWPVSAPIAEPGSFTNIAILGSFEGWFRLPVLVSGVWFVVTSIGLAARVAYRENSRISVVAVVLRVITLLKCATT
jgi:hypothetical protein